MLITATVLLVGLSADVRRQSFIESYSNSIPQYIEYYSDSGFSNNEYFLDHIEDSKRSTLLKELNIENSNINVKINAIDIIKNLSALFVMDFNPDNFYKSSYGTMVFEYEKKNANFTIEVGENSFGYFSEINNEIKHLKEEVELSKFDVNDTPLGQLNKDFVDFYYSV